MLRSAISTFVAAIAVCSLPVSAPAQQTMSPQQIQQLVSDAVHNELAPGNTYVHFYLRKKNQKGDTTKLIVETKDGDVARLVQKDGKPLSAEDDQAEIDRLNRVLAHPEEQARRHKREQEDAQHSNVVVGNLGAAFDFTYAGEGSGPTGTVIKLNFTPKPSYSPPHIEDGVLKGMAGQLWIDQRQKRIVRLDAHLISDVNFGWGILGKLYKGGTILVEQNDQVPGHWEPTLLKLDLHGKEVMMISLNESDNEQSWGFQRSDPNWSYQDAIHWLLSKPLQQWQP